MAFAPTSATAESASAALPKFERFIAARARDASSIDIAGVTRDNKVVLIEVDANLKLRANHELADNFVATEETALTLAPSSMVVVVGRLGGRGGVFLLHEGEAPRAIDSDWCLSASGVGWLERTTGEVRVHFLGRGDPPIDLRSGAIKVAPEMESNLRCGADALVVSMGDGEHLSVARLRPGAPSFATPVPVSVEQPHELNDALRERLVMPRAGNDVLVVRLGEGHVWFRELVESEGAPHPWTVSRNETGNADFHLDEETDVVDVVASPTKGGPAWILVSEPDKKSTPCRGGEAPRRIVLHTLNPEKKTIVSRPVVELACGIEAISAHLQGLGTGAHLWWTEPIADGRCSEPGLSVGAVVESSTERAGARRAPILAEAVTRIDDGRYLAVVRAGGCAPYQALGNGALAFVPLKW
ncbi:MAG: hypothetical protein NVS3B20_04530 [Polyangiales bacterium]